MLRPFEIVAVGVAIIFHVTGQLIEPVAAILDIALELPGIGRTAAMKHPLLTAPAGERTNAGRPFVIDEIVGIAAGIARRAIGGGHAGQAKPRA